MRLFTESELPGELFKLNSCQVILAGIHHDTENHEADHWGLAIIEKADYTIYVYDSGRANADFKVQLDNLLEFCQTARDKHPELENWPQDLENSENPRRWRYVYTNRSPKQVGGYNCGVYTILNAFFYAKDVQFPTYDHTQISDYRMKIYDCLTNDESSYL